MKMSLKSLALAIVLGQLVFALASTRYTAPRFEGRIYATIGVEMVNGSDLHKLNEAAHYFGQTIIGWSKFPHFTEDLQAKTGLPPSIGFSAHLQERQNIIFTVRSPQPVLPAQLFQVRNYLQGKLLEYNENSSTGFSLSNLDYEQADLTRGYFSGALFTLAFSLLLWAGWIFRRKIV